MIMKKKSISLVLAFSMLLASLYVFPVSASTAPDIKNIIYMIPDGGAMAPFYLADAVKQAGGFNKEKFPNVTPVEQGEMYLKDFLVGAETTYSANSAITDSAAGGTALSSGYKTNNGYIGITPEAKPRANILEACQDIGKKTGLVVTYEWTNATPAAFSAHDISRGNMTIMSEQIVNQGIDVVLGNTHSAFSAKKWFEDDELTSRGYKVIKTKNDLENVKAGDRIWGKLLAAYYDVKRSAATPNLAELTQTAIKALNDENKNGFFLMVEGSAVDGGGHANNAVYNVSEYLAFDEACRVAIEFAKKRNDTIVVVAPDHDTGGLSYSYSDIDKIVSDIQSGTNSSLVKWETTYHTARNGGVFMYIPDGVSYPTGIDLSKTSQVSDEFYTAYGTFSETYPQNPANVIDNIDICNWIASLINVDFDKLSDKLFVDVTDRGTYDPDTEVFEFNDKEIKIKRNSSTAEIQGLKVDLDGEIALYIEGRFYVPSKVLTADNKIRNGVYIYADYNTGCISYSGKCDVAHAWVSAVITKPGTNLSNNISESDISMIDQTKADSAGRYTFKRTVERLPGTYTVYTNYSDSAEEPQQNSFILKSTIPSMNIKSGQNDIRKMDQVKAGDELNVLLSGFDLDDDYPGVVVAAQYADGKLQTADWMPATGGSTDFGSEITESITVGSEVEKIVIYYWNKSTLFPLIASYTID